MVGKYNRVRFADTPCGVKSLRELWWFETLASSNGVQHSPEDDQSIQIQTPTCYADLLRHHKLLERFIHQHGVPSNLTRLFESLTYSPPLCVLHAIHVEMV